MNSPRVLQVLLSLNPGGTERLVVELVTRLGGEMAMAVCCLDEEGVWASDVRNAGVPVSALGRSSGFHPGLGRRLSDVARRHNADVLHCHHYSPFVYGCLARLTMPRLRVLFTEHGRLSDALPSPKRRLANYLLKRIPVGVFAVSEDLKRHIVREGFGSRAVKVIYNGIDVGPLPDAAMRYTVRARLGLNEDAVVVATVARLDAVKDLGTLVTAIAAVNTSWPAYLLVIGDGAERAALEKKASGLDLSARVRFLGHRDDAREWLAGCDVYVNSSISEGISLTILEAMAAGLPVVATHVGGTPEILTEDCGVLTPARDAGAIAAAIQRLIADAHRRRTLGEAARARVSRLFHIDRMVADYRAVYRGAA